jgi:carbonic anhydrase
MKSLVDVKTPEDIFDKYRDTPISRLFEYHNLGKPAEICSKAQMLIITCMDYRIRFRIPDRFAYVLRTGGGNSQPNEFHISYAVAVGGIEYIALIGHNHCGMVNLAARQELFIHGLTKKAGWSHSAAAELFERDAPRCEIEDEIKYLFNDLSRLRAKFPKITIEPLMYLVEDNQLYQIKED